MPGRLIYMAGMPRTGSTLMLNLFAQNPAVSVTPSSGLVDLVASLQSSWGQNLWFKAEGLEAVKPKMLSGIRGLMEGFHQKPLSEGRLVIDKSRGWLPTIELVEEAFGQKAVILCPVRDVKAIVASFEKLNRADPLARPPVKPTTEARAVDLLSAGGVVGETINFIRDALSRKKGDRILFIPYDSFVRAPQVVMDDVHQAIGLPPFKYDPNNVEQVTFENDDFHGWPLHKIRSKIEPVPPEPWKGVLSESLCRLIDEQCADINHYANPR